MWLVDVNVIVMGKSRMMRSSKGKGEKGGRGKGKREKGKPYHIEK